MPFERVTALYVRFEIKVIELVEEGLNLRDCCRQLCAACNRYKQEENEETLGAFADAAVRLDECTEKCQSLRREMSRREVVCRAAMITYLEHHHHPPEGVPFSIRSTAELRCLRAMMEWVEGFHTTWTIPVSPDSLFYGRFLAVSRLQNMGHLFRGS